MTNFFTRLNKYFLDVAKTLQGECDISSIFPNSSDKGITREKAYAEFLKAHIPSCCNVIMGGFLFDENGSESSQMDLLVVSHVSPQFNFLNKSGVGKSFAMVDGTIAAVSIKSKLDSKEIENALCNIASIPDKVEADKIINPSLKIHDYKEWPFKVVFAYDGVSIDTAWEKVNSFYEKNPNIPYWKRPDIIHVIGKYIGVKTNENFNVNGNILPPNQYFFTEYDNPDVFALQYTVSEIQKRAMISQHILFPFWSIVNKIINPNIDVPQS